MTAPITSPLSLLACMAHPSDEAFSLGGTLSLYAQRGMRVHVLFGTRGEVGEMDPALLEGFGSTAERRTYEAQCAAGILGLAGIYFLGYRDSGMPGSLENRHPEALAAQPVEQVAARLVDHIRCLKPRVIITHDPIGGYKHPDHIALNRAVQHAFDLAGDPAHVTDDPPYKPEKLYYQTLPKDWLRWAVKLAPLLRMDPHRFGRNGDIDLVQLVEEGNFPIHARIDCRSVSQLRDEASACHLSQGGQSIGRRGSMAILRRLFGSNETFMRAIPAAGQGLRERDLFDGLQ